MFGIFIYLPDKMYIYVDIDETGWLHGCTIIDIGINDTQTWMTMTLRIYICMRLNMYVYEYIWTCIVVTVC